MSVILDSGALVAVERGDSAIIAVIGEELERLRAPLTHAGVVGEVWRGGHGRQARLARALSGVDIRALDNDLGRRAGVLLGLAGTVDVIDAALVLLANDGDEIFTADQEDLKRLAEAARKDVGLVRV